MSGPTKQRPYVTTSVRADVRQIASCLHYFIKEQGVYPTSFAQLFERCVSTLYTVIEQAHSELIISDVQVAYEFYKTNVGNVPVRGKKKLLEALATTASRETCMPETADECLEQLAAQQAIQLERCAPAETEMVDEDDNEVIDTANLTE